MDVFVWFDNGRADAPFFQGGGVSTLRFMFAVAFLLLFSYGIMGVML